MVIFNRALFLRALSCAEGMTDAIWLGTALATILACAPQKYAQSIFKFQGRKFTLAVAFEKKVVENPRLLFRNVQDDTWNAGGDTQIANPLIEPYGAGNVHWPVVINRNSTSG